MINLSLQCGITDLRVRWSTIEVNQLCNLQRNGSVFMAIFGTCVQQSHIISVYTASTHIISLVNCYFSCGKGCVFDNSDLII